MGETIKTIPTVGYLVETFDYKGLNFTVWDIGGQDKMRVLWKHYIQNMDGFIFVVDSNDKDRIEVAKEELKRMLDEEDLQDCPILVMANKQDLSAALTPAELTEKMEMEQLKGRIWMVQGTSATTGKGLKEGLDWMASILLKKK